VRLKKSAKPARPPARPSEHNLLGVESGFRGPKGEESLAQGFNPGSPRNKWFALKGRQDTR
jgi:hypothetical protein